MFGLPWSTPTVPPSWLVPWPEPGGSPKRPVLIASAAWTPACRSGRWSVAQPDIPVKNPQPAPRLGKSRSGRFSKAAGCTPATERSSGVTKKKAAQARAVRWRLLCRGR